MKISAVRVKLGKDDLELTSLGQSPRGTKVRLRTVHAKKDKQSKEKFRKNIEAAIEELIAP